MLSIAKYVFILIAFAVTGCDSEFNEVPSNKPIEILSVNIFKKGEPEGYRGKALQITTKDILQRRTVTYKIKIITKNGYEVDGSGYLSSMSAPYDLTDKVMQNMYLWVPRNDTSDMWRIITDEVNPGNIKLLQISLFEYNEEIENFVFTNL